MRTDSSMRHATQDAPGVVQSQLALPYDRHLSKTSDAREFFQIQQFVAACRQQWPGAKIVLRSGGTQTGANAPPNNGNGLPATCSWVKA